MQTIRSVMDGDELYASDTAESVQECAEEAVRAGASLAGASLAGASLAGASLVGASLVGANLFGASLYGASLVGASLAGASLNWQSHDLLAELLRRAAGDDFAKRQLAGGILLSRELCWKEFLEMDHPLKRWALGVLRSYVRPGDGSPKDLLKVEAEVERVRESVWCNF